MAQLIRPHKIERSEIQFIFLAMRRSARQIAVVFFELKSLCVSKHFFAHYLFVG